MKQEKQKQKQNMYKQKSNKILLERGNRTRL